MDGLTPFQRFINLVKFDQEAVDLHKSIQTIKKELELLKTQKQDLINSQEHAKKNLASAEKEVHLQELRMSELQEKETAKKELLATTTNEKEYQALKKEIDTLRRSQSVHEGELIHSWNKLESAKKDFAAITKTLDAKIADLILTEEEKVRQLDDYTKKFDAHNVQRAEKEVGLPEEWLEKYNVMYLQVANPIVPLVGQGCSACFHDLTRQEYLDAQKKKLLQCKGCFRLLYLES